MYWINRQIDMLLANEKKFTIEIHNVSCLKKVVDV
jgi:hypothetical protein